MPTIFVYGGFRFFFCANGGEPLEPAHVHEAKLWVRPYVEVAGDAGLDARTLRRLRSRAGETRPEGRSTAISAESVRFGEHAMWVSLSTGRVPGVPLAWFPRLMEADPAAREAVRNSPFGLHWPALDEDVSVKGLLVGRGRGGWGRWRDC